MATDGPCHGEGHEGICKPTGEALGNVCEDATVFWCIVERGGEVSMVDLFAFPAVSFSSDDALLTDRLTSNRRSPRHPRPLRRLPRRRRRTALPLRASPDK